MQEITVLSGKGGTGKTSITAALASLAKHTVFCDNDVDAADLHLLLQPKIIAQHTYLSAWQAKVNTADCIACGVCMDYCRFGAISPKEDGKALINTFQCEGCRLCEKVCPEQAITSTQSTNNQWYKSETRFGTLIHARMGPGEENSGKLVTKVRQQAMQVAEEQNASHILNDGPPGIGCTAISSVTGTDVALLVIEPTLSGWHDAQRLIKLITNFDVKTYAIINKYDINTAMANEIETKLTKAGIECLEKIPFDKQIVEAMTIGKTIVEYAPQSEVSRQIGRVWNTISQC